jgi:hypothetical protein
MGLAADFILLVEGAEACDAAFACLSNITFVFEEL